MRSLATHLGVSAGVVLVPETGTPARLSAVDTRGLSDETLRGLSIAEDGELARIVAGLARPVRREELGRIRELEPELRPLIAAGVALLVPLVTRGRLVGAAALLFRRRELP